MIKKHQTRSMYATYQRTSLKLLLKKTFKPTKRNPNIRNIRNNQKLRESIVTFVSFIEKVINIVKLLDQSDGKTCCCYNIVRVIEMTTTDVYNFIEIYGNILLAYLKFILPVTAKERFRTRKTKLLLGASHRRHS